MYWADIVVVLAVLVLVGESGAHTLQRATNGYREEDSLLLAALNGQQRGRHHKSRREEPIRFGDRQASGEQPWGHVTEVRNHGRPIPSSSSGRIGDTISFGDGGFRLGSFKSDVMSSGKSVSWVPKIDRSRCSSSGFCEPEALEEYPAEAILERLKSSKNLDSLMSYFGNVDSEEVATSNSLEPYGSVRVRTHMKPETNSMAPQNDVAIRLSPASPSHSAAEIFPDGKPLCETTRSIYFPETALNKRNQAMLIVNVENYTQGVTIVKCRNPNGPCGELASSFPSGSQSSCHQKYTYRHLVAINAKDGNHVVDSFAMPSCCVCYVKTNGREGLFGRHAASLMRNAMTPARRRR